MRVVRHFDRWCAEPASVLIQRIPAASIAAQHAMPRDSDASDSGQLAAIQLPTGELAVMLWDVQLRATVIDLPSAPASGGAARSGDGPVDPRGYAVRDYAIPTCP